MAVKRVNHQLATTRLRYHLRLAGTMCPGSPLGAGRRHDVPQTPSYNRPIFRSSTSPSLNFQRFRITDAFRETLLCFIFEMCRNSLMIAVPFSTNNSSNSELI